MAGGARAGLLGLLLAIALLALLALPVLGYAADQQVPLAADLQRGIVVWSGSVFVGKTGTVNNRALCTFVGPDDTSRVKSWGEAYVAVRITNINSYRGTPTPISVTVYVGLMSEANKIYSSDYTASRLGIVEIPLPRWVVESLPNEGWRLCIYVPDWDPSVEPYGVTISQIILAPPKRALADNNQQAQQPVAVAAEEMRGRVGGLDSRTVVAAAAGAGVALLMVVVYQAARGGGRRGR